MKWLIDKFNTAEELDNEIQVAKNWLAEMQDRLPKLEKELVSKLDEVVDHTWKAITGRELIEGFKNQMEYQEPRCRKGNR